MVLLWELMWTTNISSSRARWRPYWRNRAIFLERTNMKRVWRHCGLFSWTRIWVKCSAQWIMSSMYVNAPNGLTSAYLSIRSWNTATSFDAHSPRQMLNSQNKFRKKPKEWWKCWKTWFIWNRYKVLQIFKNKNYLLVAQDSVCQTQPQFSGFLWHANISKNWKLNLENRFRYTMYISYREDDLTLEQLSSSKTDVMLIGI